MFPFFWHRKTRRFGCFGLQTVVFWALQIWSRLWSMGLQGLQGWLGTSMAWCFDWCRGSLARKTPQNDSIDSIDYSTLYYSPNLRHSIDLRIPEVVPCSLGSKKTFRCQRLIVGPGTESKAMRRLVRSSGRSGEPGGRSAPHWTPGVLFLWILSRRLKDALGHGGIVVLERPLTTTHGSRLQAALCFRDLFGSLGQSTSSGTWATHVHPRRMS